MKKTVKRLTIYRETLCQLEKPRVVAAGAVVINPETQQPACYSPLCVPTYWVGCQTAY
jgi:hypothetical protein